MRVSLYAQISLKDRPPGHLGMTGESLSIGKKKSVELSAMAISLIYRLFDYYSLFLSAEEMNGQLDRIAECCSQIRFVENEVPPCLT